MISTEVARMRMSILPTRPAVWFCAAALAGAVAADTATPPRPPRDLARRIDRHVQSYVADGHLSGTLLVAQGERILYERSWGMANYELGVPYTPATRACIASITKPMTIALFCLLAEEGKVNPADSIGKFIAGFPQGSTITLSHLLNHRACIEHRVTSEKDETQPHTAADMVERVKKSRLLPHAPGEKSVYSSAGFSVLARVLEIASGMSYGELIATRLFAPTGMTRSLHPRPHALIPDRAPSYAPGLHGPRCTSLKDLSFLVGAGSVYSTPRDLHALMRAVVTGKLGETVKMALMRAEGLRWNGITNGHRAFADYDLETGFEVIFVGNMHTGAIDRLRDDVPKLLKGQELPPPARLQLAPIEIDATALTPFEGVYESERGQKFTVRSRPWGFFAGDRQLVPISNTTFFSLEDYGRVEFVRGPSGAIERLDWEWQGQMLPWKRIADASSAED
jgi:CubicO group peptidase (beta-lactamase class C family)